MFKILQCKTVMKSLMTDNKLMHKRPDVTRTEKRTYLDKIKKSSKSVKEKRGNLSTHVYLSSQTPQKEPRTNNISFVHSKSNRKNKNSASNHHASKSKQYLTPSKDNDDIHHLIQNKTYGKLLKNKKIQQIRPFIEASHQLISRNLPKQAIKILESALIINPKSYEVNYFLGMCYLVNQQFPQALQIFKTQLHLNPKKNLFLLLSICYKKVEDYKNSLQLLNGCLLKYPRFYDGYVQRGRLYMKMKIFDKANHDFQQAILLDEDKWIAYVLKGDCLRKSNKFINAEKMYNKALKIQKSPSIVLRKIFCSIQLKKYDKALVQINKLLTQKPNNPQLLFAKGLIFRKKEQNSEALMYFEESLKNDFSKQLSARCIYEIGKIKVLQKDYYGTLLLLSKAQKQVLQHKELLRLKIFCQAIIQIMKKNYIQGITMLNNLIKQNGITKFLTSLFYSCRAYGYMNIGKFQDARTDFLKLQRQQTLSIPNLYNKYICEGILSWSQKKCQQALAYFSKASKIIPKKLQPFYYKAVTLIQFVNQIIPNEDKIKRKQYLMNALRIIKRQNTPSRKQPDLLLIKGLLEYYAKDIKNAINDINMILYEHNDSTTALYLKGLIVGQKQIYDEAIQFFNQAIDSNQKNKQYPEIFLNRAKCNILIGDQKKAFNDLQQYVSHRMVSSDIHIWAAHFLFIIGAYSDAAKAYSNINNIDKDKEILQLRLNCHIASFNFQSALVDARTLSKNYEDKKLHFDAKYLQILLKSIKSKQRLSVNKQASPDIYYNCIEELKSNKKQHPGFGKIFTQSDYKIIKAIFYFYLDNYQKAISNFEKGYKIQIKQGKNFRRKTGFQQNLQSYYNLAICNILNNNLIKAIKLLKQLNQKLQEQDIKQQINVFISQLQQQIKAPFTSPQKNKQKQIKSIELLPFPSANRLCSLYPKITLPLLSKITTRLYFDIPQVSAPEIKIQFDQKIFQKVSMKWITMRPEAPWIQRSDQGIILTDHVDQKYGQLYLESDDQESQIVNSSKQKIDSKDKSYKKEYSQQKQMKIQFQKGKYQQNESDEDQDEVQSALAFNPKKWAEQMKLGKQFQDKYKRVMNKDTGKK